MISDSGVPSTQSVTSTRGAAAITSGTKMSGSPANAAAKLRCDSASNS